MSKCIGCGITLQNKDENQLGYVSIKDKNLCTRCFRLKHYGEYKKVSLNNNDYSKIINSIPSNNLVLYIVDILSMDLSNINRFSNIILVITKRDIMPKSIKDNKIINKLKEKYNNLIDIIIVSSNKNYNIDNLYSLIKKHHNNLPVYLVGNTNSGKSTLINKLINNYSDTKSNITISMYPSTTLDKIEIKLNKITIIDTPGLIDNNNITNYIDNKDLKLITPKKEIKPKTCQLQGTGSILIGELVRINYTTKNTNSITIYVSNMIPIRFASLSSNKLIDLPNHKYNNISNKDIVIPGLGFIKCNSSINIELRLNSNIIPYLRDNLI